MRNSLEATLIRLEAKQIKIEQEISVLKAQLAQNREANRCRYRRYTNTPCVLEINHMDKHQITCAEHGKHNSHTESTGEYYIVCGGRVFDAT